MIYEYIKMTIKEPAIALEMVELIEANILKLDRFPYRGAERKVGMYANKGYRQVFIKNYIVVYRVDEDAKEVIIISIRYSSSNF